MKFIFAWIMLFWALGVKSQNFAVLMKQGSQMEASYQEPQALSVYKKALELEPANVTVLCKCSELASRIGGRETKDAAQAKEYFNEALSYAQRAIAANPQSSEANFVMALSMSNEAAQLDGKEKLQAVKDIKKYVDLAIFFDKRNYKAWYILGKWNFAMSTLNFMQRTAVKLFFKDFPPASLPKAIQCFEKSKAINPGFLLNYLTEAQAYRENDQDELAIQDLKEMLSLPNVSMDDQELKNQGKALLDKWN